MSDFVSETCETIKAATGRGTVLYIEGGGSKAFYGRYVDGEPLRTDSCRGIVDYEPSELVLTARAGTSLEEVERELSAQGQMLPFEPPHFGAGATIGGAVASGLSGPRRPHVGAVRDLVLGCAVINGFGEHLAFGGRVMKNVAGYDVSRLMAGALGTLGVIVEVSMKVLPRPLLDQTLVFEHTQQEAIDAMNRWAGQPLPVSATAHDGEKSYVRLSGTETGVRSAARRLGGETLPDTEFWTRVRDHQHSFFKKKGGLWRVSVPPATPSLELPVSTFTDTFLEWGGGLRWIVTDASADSIRRASAEAGGHATWFRGHDGNDVFHPLDEAKLSLHRNLKRAFDPHRVLNPGRMYAEI